MCEDVENYEDFKKIPSKARKRFVWTTEEKTLYAMYLIVFPNPFVGKEHSLMQY